MLSRAAARTLRARPTLTVLRTWSTPLASSQWRRTYAKNDRIPPGNGKNKVWKPSDGVKFAQESSSRSIPMKPSSQPEFDTPAEPDANTAPTSSPGPGISEAGQPEPQTEFQKEQDESSVHRSENGNVDTSAEHAQRAQNPLPDLRQGIPSTFRDEFGGAEGKPREHDPNNITDDPAQEPNISGRGGGREGGELPKSAYETSTDRRRNRVANWGYAIFAALSTVGIVYLSRNWETEEEERLHPEAPSGWSPGAMYDRAKARLNSQMGYYTEPAFPKLLPTVDPQPPLTLVISLEDMLLHSEWSREAGWRMAKRPGVDYFLRYLSQYYEIVIFTTQPMTYADPVIRKLDPFRVAMWTLFREATRYENGVHIKDLSYLNRDTGKIVVLDTDLNHIKYHPENAIILPKWKGEPGDKGLVALIPFLEWLAMNGTTDVRPALKSFEGQDVAQEFARREAKMREEFNRQFGSQKSKQTRHNLGSSALGALGLKPQAQGGLVLEGQSVAEGLAEGKMLSDIFREAGQKRYEAMDKEIRENGEKWLKEMAEEEKKLMDEHMKSMKNGMFGGFLGNPASGPSEKK